MKYDPQEEFKGYLQELKAIYMHEDKRRNYKRVIEIVEAIYTLMVRDSVDMPLKAKKIINYLMPTGGSCTHQLMKPDKLKFNPYFEGYRLGAVKLNRFLLNTTLAFAENDLHDNILEFLSFFRKQLSNFD